MTTTTTASRRTPAHAERVRRALELELTAAPDALARVVMTLHRRDCRIIGLEFAAGGVSSSGALVVQVDVAAGRAHCLEHWLRRLADVIEVRLDRQ